MTEPVLRWAWLGKVGYQDAWALQREISLARRSGALTDDVLLLLEHPPVYTVGRQGEARHLGAGPEALVAAGAEFLEVDRGGSVTFHGPGQLVAYPIVRLAGIFPIAGHPAHGDVDRYLRALEAGLIATAGGMASRWLAGRRIRVCGRANGSSAPSASSSRVASRPTVSP